MRRAVIATAGTVAGLVALLGYRSSGGADLKRVNVGTGLPGPSATTLPSGAPTTAAPVTKAPASSAPRTYDGQLVSYAYGDIEVAVTMAGRRVVNVTVPQNDAVDGRSAMINSEAVPILVQEALAAQGVNIDVVSGATFTSDAFAQSLQSALAGPGQ
jgi:uncharacterized protein with FMN-binding domain